MNSKTEILGGVSVTWIDRETLEVCMSRKKVKILVDYAPGLFNRWREVKDADIASWDSGAGESKQISADDKSLILEALNKYFHGRLRVL